METNRSRLPASNGDARLIDGVTYIGNYSMLGININDIAYVQYRTDISELLDEMVQAINNQTIEEA